MALELNREYPVADEDEMIEKMVKIVVARMEPQQGRMRRAQHAKATGCVRGVFTIREDLPTNVRYGVFQEPNRSFPAVVRFSNSPETLQPDGEEAARGMSVKLRDVDGAPAVPGSTHRSQDFVTVNHPVFPFATPAEYLKFFEIRRAPLVGDPLAAAWLTVFHNRHMTIANEIRKAIAADPLELTYWSASPYRLGYPESTGGCSVKYSFTPLTEKTTPPEDPQRMPPDYLSRALSDHLRAREAVFDVRVQIQIHPDTMPIEDVSVVWDEAISKPISVATLTIGVQDVDSPEGRALSEECESMSFSPWNALAEHRPMGGINRLRKAVYLASQTKRAAKIDS